jgi:hypothetical protein
MGGKAQATLVLEQAILAIVEERAPIMVRGVCYALFVRGLIESMAVRDTGRISRIMTAMRENETLDWTKIVDGSRAVQRATLWTDPNEIIRAAVRGYRRNNWQNQAVIVEVWSEKSTVQGGPLEGRGNRNKAHDQRGIGFATAGLVQRCIQRRRAVI